MEQKKESFSIINIVLIIVLIGVISLIAYTEIKKRSQKQTSSSPAVSTAPPQGASSSTNNAGPVKVFEHCDYVGASSEKMPGRYSMDAMGIPGDRISSIKVPNGRKIKAYEHPDYAGAFVEFTSDQPCLVSNGWNDRISSFEII